MLLMSERRHGARCALVTAVQRRTFQLIRTPSIMYPHIYPTR